MKKMMFNDRYGLTDAVIEGRKTMTRRLIPDEFFGLTWDTRGNTLVYENEYGDFIDVRLSKYTRYKVGEIVAVAQNYFSTYDESKWENGIWYNEFADGSDITNHAGWLNKMLVKAEYMPHQIRITGIHCERLQDISDAECLKEGVRVEFARNGGPMYYYFDTKRWREVWFDTPREAFAALIDKVSGRGTWASNPWVVVCEFELVK
jgi:hypothetical protein|nr:MAG TPA: ASCH domain protein [Caudoviricetes sp.]